MVTALLLLLGMEITDVDSVVRLFKKAWQTIEDYECSLESEVRQGNEKEYRVYEYKFKKPKWIFMKIVVGKDKGAKLVYNPITNKVLACKSGLLSFIKITADPTDRRITSIRGDRIDESYWGTIFEGGSYDLKNSEQRIAGEEIFEGRKTWLIEVVTSKPELNRGIAKEKFWIDQEQHLPLRFEQWDKEGTLVHRVVYRQIKINTGIGSAIFKL